MAITGDFRWPPVGRFPWPLSLKPWQAPAPKITSLTTTVIDQETQDPPVVLVRPEADSLPVAPAVPSEESHPVAVLVS